jgi:AcrR family transcriptional regulator
MEKRLPASIESAWGVGERPGKGPKPGLSLARIVAAAVDVASSEGLGAVSMGRIAAELGAATMALYRYVASKDELLALMVDAPFDPPPAPLGAGEDWRSALGRWAREHHAVLRRHPWIVRVPIGGPPITPNHTVWFELGLGCLADTGLDEGEKVSVLLLVNGYVRNEASLDADLAAAAGAKDSTLAAAMSSYSAVLSRLVDAERFPAITAALAAGVFDGPDDREGGFEFGLERVLDGVAALVAQRTKKRSRRG